MTAPQLDDAVTAVAARRPALLIIDLSEVTFLSSAGLEVLVHAQSVIVGAVRVVADGPATARPIQVLGLDDVLDLYPTVAAARHEPLPPPRRHPL